MSGVAGSAGGESAVGGPRGGQPVITGAGLLSATRRLLTVVAFGVLPVTLAVAVIALAAGHGSTFYDFAGDLYGAGRAILHGRDPYEAAFLDHVAALAHAGLVPQRTFAVPIYPAPALLVATPFALSGERTAGLLFTLLSIGAMVGGLRLLGVRDWRCYGAAFLSWPLLHSLRLGQVNELLVLGAGAAWHWRARIWPAAAAVASLVAVKLFLWPLGLWLVLSRRRRTALLAAALAAAATLGAWALIGFDGFAAYPRMLSDLSAVEGGAGVSLISLAGALGLSSAAGDALTVLVTAGLLAGAWWWSRSGASDGEQRAFGLAVIAALACSPVLWPHYLTLVFVPIALLEPELSVLWLVPLLAYLAPVELTGGDLLRMLPYFAIESIVAARLCLRSAPLQWRPRYPPERVGPTGRLRRGLE